MRFYFIILLLLCDLTIHAQNRINHILNDKSNSIEFRSPENKLIKKIDVLELNRYSKLNYASTRKVEHVTYKLSQSSIQPVLNSFFLSKKEEVLDLRPTGMIAISHVATQPNYTIVSDVLKLYGKGGMLGIKSVATIYDETGTVISKLPENNDGYFEPVVTSNGKYLGVLYGDIVPDTELTLVPQPGFRIYDTHTGLKIVDVPSTSTYSVLPAALYNNIIIGALQYSNGEFEYLLFNTDQRIVYKRKFSAQEIGRMSKFTDAGIWLREGLGEKLLNYTSDFTTDRF